MYHLHTIWLYEHLADEFSKFKDENGPFYVDIINDPRGLLSLYNAAYLLIDGETELEKTILFARKHLESVKNYIEYLLAEHVKRALHLPLPRTLKRVEALHYMPEYNEELTYNSSILELAKLDFGLLQRLHLKELKALSRYWHHQYYIKSHKKYFFLIYHRILIHEGSATPLVNNVCTM
jgi:(-)-germacrene D synthase